MDICNDFNRDFRLKKDDTKKFILTFYPTYRWETCGFFAKEISLKMRGCVHIYFSSPLCYFILHHGGELKLLLWRWGLMGPDISLK